MSIKSQVKGGLKLLSVSGLKSIQEGTFAEFVKRATEVCNREDAQ